MLIWLPIPFLILSVALLIRAEEREPRDVRSVWVWKPLATLLVIAVCALSFTGPAGAAGSTYTWLILIGLALSFAGDLLLIDRDNRRAFTGGLIAFLLAHVAYIAACVHAQSARGLLGNGAAEIAAGAGLAVIAGGVYRYLSPGLGSMRGPVIAYILIISLMVHSALAVLFAYDRSGAQPGLMAAGAILFYISDAILAVNRFRFGNQLPRGRLWNLTTYYGGQLLIALSASFFI